MHRFYGPKWWRVYLPIARSYRKSKPHSVYLDDFAKFSTEPGAEFVKV